MSFEILNPIPLEERPPRFVYQPPEWDKMRQIEKDRYKDQEKKRWIEGYNGLTGKHYYHLTRGNIKHGTGGGTIKPWWREADEMVFQTIDEAERRREDYYGVKRREFGWSVIFGGCLPNWFVSTNIGCSVSMTSCDKPRTANLFGSKFIPFYDNIDFDFHLSDGDDPVFQPKKVRVNDTSQNAYLRIVGSKNGKIEKSQIICPETVSNPQALSSHRVKYLFVDEFALHDKVDEVIRSADDALNYNGVRDGFFAAGGTVEADISQEALKRIQKLLSLRGDQLKASKKAVVFIPAWMGRYLYEGEDGELLYIPGTRNGWDNEKFATEVIMRKRDAYITAGDEKGLNAYIKNHPLTIDEVISAVGSGTLPSDLAEKVNRQKRYILKERPPVFGYDLKEDDKGNVIAEPNPKSPIIIYKMPDLSSPKGTYIAANDPIPYGNNDIGSGSMDSLVIKNIHTQEYVAYYMERNLDPNYVNYKKVLLQRMYLDAQNMLEMNRGEVTYRYYMDNGYLKLLARRPLNMGLKIIKNQPMYGVFRNDPKMIDIGNSLFYEYIRNHIDKFMFDVGIDQILSFDPKNVNNDMVDAIIWCEIYHEEIKRKNKKLSNNEDVSTITIPVRRIVNGRTVVDFIEKRVKNNG